LNDGHCHHTFALPFPQLLSLSHDLILMTVSLRHDERMRAIFWTHDLTNRKYDFSAWRRMMTSIQPSCRMPKLRFFVSRTYWSGLDSTTMSTSFSESRRAHIITWPPKYPGCFGRHGHQFKSKDNCWSNTPSGPTQGWSIPERRGCFAETAYEIGLSRRVTAVQDRCCRQS
jgi:hypothetical protein